MGAYVIPGYGAKPVWRIGHDSEMANRPVSWSFNHDELDSFNYSIPGSAPAQTRQSPHQRFEKGVTKASRTLLLSEHMDSSLHEVWQAAAGRPFYPAVDKANHFTVASILLLIGLLLTGFFALNRSLVTVPLIGIPSSLAIAFGVVYMFCAVGVYV
ncbi:hypothetical protein S40285_07561 [Stachybotrys chlorohalonatus IBT 40285]|uniref:Dolichyl-diphosphooligosaccharide-protein glycosyltransferase subunit OST5 n=1 Tax=Stachybotrys chlorohalonatus (strain IBT 40285) TaxID=1283841 RepID=A0A084Q8C2_STAC4|nr:hypothetical protein S40285_07561 [Stachybotrys chlorohalonata IBT 40285]